MANLIQGGVGAINDMRQEARQLGLVLSNDLIARSEQAADELGDMTKLLQVAGTTLGLEFMPLMRELFKILTDPTFIAGARDLGQNLADGLRWVVDNADVIGAVVGALAGFRLAGPLGAAGGAIGGIALAGDTAGKQIRALNVEIQSLEDRLQNLDNAPAMFNVDEEIEQLTMRLLDARNELARLQGTGSTQPLRVEITKEIEREVKETESLFKRLAEAWYERQREIDLTEADRIWDETRTAAENYKTTIERLDELLRRGALSQDTYNRAVRMAADEFADVSDEVKKAEEATKDFGFTFTSSLEDAIVSGGELSDVLRGLERDILRIATRRFITNPLTNTFDGLLGGLFPKRWRIVRSTVCWCRYPRL